MIRLFAITLISLAVPAIFSPSTYAETLTCRFDGSDEYLFQGNDKTFLVFENLDDVSCEMSNGDYTVASINGIGVGFRFNEEGKFRIHCPGQKNLRGTYAGPRIAFAPGAFHAQVGFFVGAGVCFLEGLDLYGFGLSVSVPVITIGY